MKTEESIKKVLALFDDEDIPYIRIQAVQNIASKAKKQDKIKKLGAKNDRFSKK